jgi:hypothetical protein
MQEVPGGCARQWDSSEGRQGDRRQLGIGFNASVSTASVNWPSRSMVARDTPY